MKPYLVVLNVYCVHLGLDDVDEAGDLLHAHKVFLRVIITTWAFKIIITWVFNIFLIYICLLLKVNPLTTTRAPLVGSQRRRYRLVNPNITSQSTNQSIFMPELNPPVLGQVEA